MAKPTHDPADDLEASVEPDQDSGKGLRAQLKKANARIKQLESESQAKFDDLEGQLMQKAFDDLGLDRDHGIGKAASIMYDGDPDGLAGFMESEFGYYGAENPLTPIITDGHLRLDHIGSTSGSVPYEAPWDQELAKAESQGDYQKTMAMKSQQIAGML